MGFSLDSTQVFAEAIGPTHGLTPQAVARVDARYDETLVALEQRREEGEIGFADVPYEPMILAPVLQYREQVKGAYSNIVVVGIGGSALGARAIIRALTHPEYNALKPHQRNDEPRLFFCDNIDPETVGGILDLCPPEQTLFVIVSKSGATLETIATFRLVWRLLQARVREEAIGDHLVFVTDPRRGYLRTVARDKGIRTFPIPTNVGGRFSALTAVGLVPAALIGLDVDAIVSGARALGDRVSDEGLQHWPWQLAVAHFLLLTEKQKHTSVTFAAGDAFRGFGLWYAQLWAESLGKRCVSAGTSYSVGLTPLAAYATSDQHSLMQLFLEGPNDKVYTIIEAETPRRNLPVPPAPIEDEALAVLDDRTLGDVLASGVLGTRAALIEAARPTLALTIDLLSAQAVGELLFGYEIATAYLGTLLGIDAFNQPGVQAGKQCVVNQLRARPKVPPSAAPSDAPTGGVRDRETDIIGSEAAAHAKTSDDDETLAEEFADLAGLLGDEDTDELSAEEQTGEAAAQAKGAQPDAGAEPLDRPPREDETDEMPSATTTDEPGATTVSADTDQFDVVSDPAS